MRCLGWVVNWRGRNSAAMSGHNDSGWRIFADDTEIGTAYLYEVDQPWFICKFEPAATFNAYRPIFDEYAALVNNPTPDTAHIDTGEFYEDHIGSLNLRLEPFGDVWQGEIFVGLIYNANECWLLPLKPSIQQTALTFNDCINARHIDGLAALMSDDHTFIDAVGSIIVGKAACLDAWRGFFATFPDYQNHFTEVTAHDVTVSMLGHSTCSYELLNGPAIWTARVVDEQVAEWHVYEDSPEVRRFLKIGLD